MWYRVLEGLFCMFIGAVVAILFILATIARSFGKSIIEIVRVLIR
jgi:hypothetical protein